MVVEREVAGFGASGRNGGWCVGDQAAPLPVLDKIRPGAAAAMVEEMHRAVDEVGEVARRENIDCGFAKGGAIYLASNPFQLRRLARHQAVHERFGLGDAYRLLSPREATAVVNAAGTYGALFTPHAAALHPARLARGLAVAVERTGGIVHERTAVQAIEPGRLRTDHGIVRAQIVVRATEGYTASLDGHERAILPLGNFMIATEPLDDSVWAEIGLANREVFEDTIPMVAYGQRTSDGRIAWGGLGAPYWWRSGVPSSPMADASDREAAANAPRHKVPRARRRRDHPPLGRRARCATRPAPERRTRPLDRVRLGGRLRRFGCRRSNAAGRTLADLVTGTDSDLTRLPWVGHRSPPWEREPLRWLGVRARMSHARATGRLESSGLRRAARPSS